MSRLAIVRRDGKNKTGISLNSKDKIIRFDRKFQYHPSPGNPNNFIRPCIIDVVCFSEMDNEIVEGKIALDHLDICRDKIAGLPLYEFCDADSAGWEHVYSSTIEPGINSAEIRRDFGFEEYVASILFIYQAVFHPCLRDWQCIIFDHACGLFGEDSATVM